MDDLIKEVLAIKRDREAKAKAEEQLRIIDEMSKWYHTMLCKATGIPKKFLNERRRTDERGACD